MGGLFGRVNTVLGNIKPAITGTHRSLRTKYAFRYLAEFQFSFNKRYCLADTFDELAILAAHTKPKPHRLLAIA